MSERSLFAAIGVSTLEWRIPLEGPRPVERAAKQASRCRPVVGPEPRWESPRPPLPRRSARESRSRPQAAGPRGKGAEVGPFQRLPPVWRVTRRPPSSKGGRSRSPARGPRPACGRAPVACSLPRPSGKAARSGLQGCGCHPLPGRSGSPGHASERTGREPHENQTGSVLREKSRRCGHGFTRIPPKPGEAFIFSITACSDMDPNSTIQCSGVLATRGTVPGGPQVFIGN